MQTTSPTKAAPVATATQQQEQPEVITLDSDSDSDCLAFKDALVDFNVLLNCPAREVARRSEGVQFIE